MFWGFYPGFWMDSWIYWMGNSACAPIRICLFETNLHHLIFYTDVSFCTMKIKGVFCVYFPFVEVPAVLAVSQNKFNSRNSWKSKVKLLSGILALPSLWHVNMQRARLIEISIHWMLTSHGRALSDWEGGAETIQQNEKHFFKRMCRSIMSYSFIFFIKNIWSSS